MIENLLIEELREKANELPFHPGVYLMKDKNDKIIYVGKSKALKNRVSQYFNQSAKHDIKTEKMVSDVFDFQYMLTDTELEALTLENRLIKLHMPKYNIKLKDGKAYPYIKVTLNDPFPTVSVVRKRTNDNAKYFGPYTAANVAYSVQTTVRKTFKLASCDKQFPRDIGKSRPCLYKQLGQCLAPCSGAVSSDEYREVFKDVITFLKGNYTDVKNSLIYKMNFASDNLMFESAALLRDQISSLERLSLKQKVVGSPDTEQDIISLYSDDLCSCITVFYVRSGCITDSEHFIFPADRIIDTENITAFLTDLYLKREYVPKDILLSFRLSDDDSQLFHEAYKVNIRTPERGELKALCDMVYDNAKQYAEQFKIQAEKDNKTLVKLAALLSLEVVPERIEAFDVSNYANDNITAGMIVAENAKLVKSDYRIYKISSSETQDDYASMREAVSRRLSHAGKFPDLIFLDGGKGHVSTIKQLLSELEIDIPVFGMVKDEFHKTRALTDETDEISIAREQAVFMFIYKLQEEVHRFTVSRMTEAKSKSIKTSSLEKIKGIGAVKAQELLRHFKTLSAVKSASKAELLAVKGISEVNAESVLKYFAKQGES